MVEIGLAPHNEQIKYNLVCLKAYFIAYMTKQIPKVSKNFGFFTFHSFINLIFPPKVELKFQVPLSSLKSAVVITSTV
jgi:hypothetical protein